MPDPTLFLLVGTIVVLVLVLIHFIRKVKLLETQIKELSALPAPSTPAADDTKGQPNQLVTVLPTMSEAAKNKKHGSSDLEIKMPHTTTEKQTVNVDE